MARRFEKMIPDPDPVRARHLVGPALLHRPGRPGPRPAAGAVVAAGDAGPQGLRWRRARGGGGPAGGLLGAATGAGVAGVPTGARGRRPLDSLAVRLGRAVLRRDRERIVCPELGNDVSGTSRVAPMSTAAARCRRFGVRGCRSGRGRAGAAGRRWSSSAASASSASAGARAGWTTIDLHSTPGPTHSRASVPADRPA